MAAAALMGTFACGEGEMPSEAGEDGARAASAALSTDVETQQLTFDVVADARVDAETPDTNAGSTTRLRVDGDPASWSYLRFDVTGVNDRLAAGWSVERVFVRLYAATGTSKDVSLYEAPNGWTESGVTWNTRPQLPGGGFLYDEPRSVARAFPDESFVELGAGRTEHDGAIVDGAFSYVLAPVGFDGCCLNTDGASFVARESTLGASKHPKLVVELTRATAPPPSPLVLRPVEDTYVSEGTPGTAYASASDLQVDTGPAIQSLLRFDVQGLAAPPARAVLRLHVTNGSANGPKLYATTPWSGAPTWSTRPTVQGTAVADLAALTVGQWVELDVTRLVPQRGGVFFGLLPDSSDGADFASVNHPDASLRPQLVLTPAAGEEEEPPPPPPPPPPATTVQLRPVQDGYVSEAAAGTAYASAADLQVDTGPATHSYLRFEVPALGAPVKRAVLVLYVTNGSANGPKVYGTAAWSSAPTWNSRPSLQGTPVADLGALTEGRYVEVDVTRLVPQSGGVFIGLVPDSSDGADFGAVDHPEASMRPQLRVTTEGTVQPPPPPPPPPPAETQTLRFTPVADSSAREAEPDRAWGGAPVLYVDTPPVDEAHLRFQVTGLAERTVARAVLRLHALNGSSGGPMLYRTGSAWSEGTMTWRTRPARTSGSLGQSTPVTGQWVEYDVTTQVRADGDFGFVLAPTSGDGADFASREASDPALRPQLVITVEAPAAQPGAVQAAYGYDRGSDVTNALAQDPASGHVLLGWGGVGVLRLERHRADGSLVWERSFPVTSLPPADGSETPFVVARAAAFAPDGSVWMLLNWSSSTVDLGQGPLPAGFYLVHLSANGAPLFVRGFWSEAGRAYPWELAVDGTGHVAVTGQYSGTPDLGAGPVAGVSAVESGFVARYTPAGALHWARAFGNTEWGVGYDVDVSATGEVVVAGAARGVDRTRFADGFVTSPFGAAENEGVLARLSADGALLWAKGVGRRLTHVALSRQGTAVAAGSGLRVDWAGKSRNTFGTFLIAADASGGERWMLEGDRAGVSALAMDEAGSVRVLSGFQDFAGGRQPSEERPLAVERIDLDGTHRWTQWLPRLDVRTHEGISPRLALAPSGEAWVFGRSSETPKTFGTFPLSLPPDGTGSVLLRLAP